MFFVIAEESVYSSSAWVPVTNDMRLPHSVYSISPVNVVAVPAEEAVTHRANAPDTVNGTTCDHQDVVAVRPVIAAGAEPPPVDTAVTRDAFAIPDSCSGVTAEPPAFVPVTVLMENTIDAFDGNDAAPITPQRTAEMLMSEFADVEMYRIGVDVVVVTVAPVAVQVAESKTPIL